MLPLIIDEKQGTEVTRYIIREIDSQRNGVSGEGFYVVRFTYMVGEVENHEILGKREELIAVLFHDAERTAIIDPENLGSHWRGDMFATTLREAISTYKGYDAWQ